MTFHKRLLHDAHRYADEHGFTMRISVFDYMHMGYPLQIAKDGRWIGAVVSDEAVVKQTADDMVIKMMDNFDEIWSKSESASNDSPVQPVQQNAAATEGAT